MRHDPLLEAGSKIDGYTLEKCLGGGQDGEVWRVMPSKLKKPRAMKILRHIDSDEARERFDREIQILTSINHVHIVDIHDAGEATCSDGETVVYYVMEYLARIIHR